MLRRRLVRLPFIRGAVLIGRRLLFLALPVWIFTAAPARFWPDSGGMDHHPIVADIRLGGPAVAG